MPVHQKPLALDCVVFGMTLQAVVQGTPAPPPLPPLPPLPAGQPGVAVVEATSPATTLAELMNLSRRQLSARRDELSRQLTSASERRQDLVGELRTAPTDAVRAGLEGRISLLDQRILKLEREIDLNGQALTNKAGEAVVIQPPRGGEGFGRNPDRAPRVIGIVALTLLFPLAFAMARRIWRGSPPPVVRRDAEGDARLERIEQAVDAIAIEIERISEAQRFQNKLLGEGQAVGAFGFARAREGERVGGS